MLYLQHIEKISIPKNVLPPNNDQQEIELHDFSDTIMPKSSICQILNIT